MAIYPNNYLSVLQAERRQIIETLKLRGHSLESFSKIESWSWLPFISYSYGSLVFVFVLWFLLPDVWRWISFLGIPFIQHAFFNIVHEASHNLIHPNSRANFWLGNLCGWPIGINIESYGIAHRTHHRDLNTPSDPAYYVTRPDHGRMGVVLSLFFTFCGRYFWSLLSGASGDKRANPASGDRGAYHRRIWQLLGFHIPLLLVCVHYEMFVFWMFWIFSTLTFLPLLESASALVEHRRLPEDPPEFHTRSHHQNAVISALAAPFFQYHWEHHVLPEIPHSQLARIHRILEEEPLPQAQVQPWIFFAVLARLMVYRHRSRKAEEPHLQHLF